MVQEGCWGEELCCEEETNQLFNLLPRKSLVGGIRVLGHQHHSAGTQDGAQAGRSGQDPPKRYRKP